MKSIKLNLLLILLLTITFISCKDDDDNSVTPAPDVEYELEINTKYNVNWAGGAFSATIATQEDNTFSGLLCKGTDPNNCDPFGPIQLTENENGAIDFTFTDTTCLPPNYDPNQPAFTGAGTIDENGKITLKVNGEDCITTYTNNTVIFEKID